MRFLLSLVLISSFSVAQVSAQTSTSTLETSKLSMNVDVFSEADNKFSNDTLNMWADLNTFYELSENNRLTFRNTFGLRPGQIGDRFNYDGVELHWRRKNILTEEENGVRVQADLRMGYNVNQANRTRFGNYGNVHARVYFKKTLNPNFSVNGLLRYYRFLTTKNANDKTFNSRYRAMAWTQYDFNDKWSIGTAAELSDRICRNSREENTHLQLEQAVQHNFTKDTLLRAYSFVRPFKSFDNEGWRRDTFKDATFGLEFLTTIL